MTAQAPAERAVSRYRLRARPVRITVMAGGVFMAVLLFSAVRNLNPDAPASLYVWWAAAFLMFVAAWIAARSESQLVNAPLLAGAGWALLTLVVDWLGPGWAAVHYWLGPSAALMLSWLLLRWPDPRVTDPLARALLPIAFITVGIARTIDTVTWDPVRGDIPDEPWPTLVRADTVHDITFEVEKYLFLGLLLMLVAMVARRVIRAPRGARQAVLPAVLGAALVLAGETGAIFIDSAPAEFTPPWNMIEASAYMVVPVTFLLSVFGARLDRATMVERLIGSDVVVTPGTLQERLAELFGEPDLELQYRSDDGTKWITADGATAAAVAPGMVAVSLPSGAHAGGPAPGEPTARLVGSDRLQSRTELLESVARATAIALENGRLQTELAARLLEVRESRTRLAEVAMAERRRIERDLHDGVQQRILGLGTLLGRALHDLGPAHPVSPLLVDARNEVRVMLADVREIVRGVHPGALAQGGLAAAVEDLSTRLPVDLRWSVPEIRLPADVESCAWFVVAEGVTNAVKHGQCSTIDVTVQVTDAPPDDDRTTPIARGTTGTVPAAGANGRREVSIHIDDDGTGGAIEESGGGLEGLRDRVEALDGRLVIGRSPAGGTRVEARLVCV